MRHSPAVPRLAAVLLAATFALACGPPTLHPNVGADATVACPGGRTAWSLEIHDQRANREGSEKLVALLRDSLTKSFPGCDWSAAASPDRPSILIEIHRFSAPLEDESWNGAAEWEVLVRDAGGRTITDYEAQADVERPNYRNSNNEKEALQQVFDGALQKTLAVLRSVPAGG